MYNNPRSMYTAKPHCALHHYPHHHHHHLYHQDIIFNQPKRNDQDPEGCWFRPLGSACHLWYKVAVIEDQICKDLDLDTKC